MGLGLDRDTLRALTEKTIAAADGAKDAEWEFVQTAIDLMMVHNQQSTVTASGTATKITGTTNFGSGLSIAVHLLVPSTMFCYIWDSTGLILPPGAQRQPSYVLRVA